MLAVSNGVSGAVQLERLILHHNVIGIEGAEVLGALAKGALSLAVLEVGANQVG